MMLRLKPYKSRLFGWRKVWAYRPRIIREGNGERHLVWRRWVWTDGYFDNSFRRWSIYPQSNRKPTRKV